MADKVYDAVVAALTQIQTYSGRAAQAINGATRPIGDLIDFDSHSGLEFGCEIELQLKINIPTKVNLCVDDGQHRACTVNEIVERARALIKETIDA